MKKPLGPSFNRAETRVDGEIWVIEVDASDPKAHTRRAELLRGKNMRSLVHAADAIWNIHEHQIFLKDGHIPLEAKNKLVKQLAEVIILDDDGEY